MNMDKPDLCNAIAMAITDVMRTSLNEKFKYECYRVLKVSSTNEAKTKVLSLLTEACQQKNKILIKEEDAQDDISSIQDKKININTESISLLAPLVDDSQPSSEPQALAPQALKVSGTQEKLENPTVLNDFDEETDFEWDEEI